MKLCRETKKPIPDFALICPHCRKESCMDSVVVPRAPAKAPTAPSPPPQAPVSAPPGPSPPPQPARATTVPRPPPPPVAPPWGGRSWQWGTIALAAGGGLAGCIAVILLVLVLMPKGADKTPTNAPAEVVPPPEKEKVLTAAEINTQCGPSVARIRHRFATGSGFLITPGFLVTNCHVVDGDLIRHLEVTFPSAAEPGRSFSATLLYEDRKRDVAVLKIVTSLKPLALAGADPDVGTEVIVIGSPASGLPGQVAANTVTNGLLSNKNIRLGDGVDYHQLSAPINAGNSGGPVFNTRGQVIGVATATLRDKQAMNYAVPLVDLRKAVEKAREQSERDQERVAAEHDFVEVFRRVARSATYCAAVMGFYTEHVRESTRKKERPSEGVQRAAEKYGKPLVDLINKELSPIRNELTGVTSNKSIPEGARQRLRELWDLFQDMANWIDNPRGTIAEFEDKARDCRERVNRLIQGLQLELGVDKID